MIRTPYALHFTLHARETNQPWRGEKQEKFKNQDLTPMTPEEAFQEVNSRAEKIAGMVGSLIKAVRRSKK
ncbi:hypothetical protein DRN98_10290 [Methanosarcinales archaeon]|nr:MAG: hypothetical protein DRN98_10290 [Methanosarcinales archaeon]